MPTKTPLALPDGVSGIRLYVPDSPEFKALVVGCIASMANERYWEKREDGLTVDETVQAVIDIILWRLEY